MNKLVLLELTDEHVVYSFQPEGKGTPGQVKFIFGEEDARLIEKAEDNNPWYSNHALVKIEAYARDRYFPPKATQAWY